MKRRGMGTERALSDAAGAVGGVGTGVPAPSAEYLAAVVATQNEIATADLSLDAIMSLIIERCQQLTRADGGVIELAEGDEVVYRAAAGTAVESLGLRLKIDASLSGLSVRTGQILCCEDSETDPRVDREACRKVGVRSMIVVPLSHADKVVGVLKVYSKRPNVFGPQDVGTLQLMAGLMAAVLARTQVIEELQTALAEVKTLRGMIPICMYCRSIRNDSDYWQRLEDYLEENSEAVLSHGICPKCWDQQVKPQLLELGHKDVEY
jgi:putative methionine-R-sulfoxide reductase with GAF domain